MASGVATSSGAHFPHLATMRFTQRSNYYGRGCSAPALENRRALYSVATVVCDL
jgi:hypothetical protein